MPTVKTKKAITRYVEAVGKRKTAIARVRITPAAKTSWIINNQELIKYFPTAEGREIVNEALTIASDKPTVAISVRIQGGGLHAQAEAVRHGLARALALLHPTSRGSLKKAKLLTRDARIKERRKFGLKKARKAPQWSKR